jgi:hypothetical protein
MNTNAMAPLFRYLLKPVALLAYVLAGWRLGADMNWTGEFFISKGLLSHWQVWLALAIGTQITAAHLAPRADEHDDLIIP